MRGHKLSDDHWLQLFEEFKTTDLTLVEFCKQHDIGESTFYQKRSSLTKYKKKKVVEPVTPVVFEPVFVTTTHDICMEINGVSIKGDIHTLRSLLGVDS